MINEFLQSWSLFSDTYIGAILIGLCLSLLGVVVVARGNVFVAAALSQASLFCLLYTSPSPRDATLSRMPSSA